MRLPDSPPGSALAKKAVTAPAARLTSGMAVKRFLLPVPSWIIARGSSAEPTATVVKNAIRGPRRGQWRTASHTPSAPTANTAK
jgi:hypothetical protein